MTGTLLSGASTPTLPAVCGLPLAAYRPEHVHRCALRAIQREGVRDLTGLAVLLEADEAARTRFRRSVTMSNSGLFRDPTQLRWLDKALLPGITAGARHVRAWSAGCCAGEEAFTLATMFEWHGVLGRTQVVGSDILEENLAAADSGFSGGGRIPASLRSRIEWDRRDLVHGGAPDGEFDLILCRGVFPYLTASAALGVQTSLASALAPAGILLLGRDEQLGAAPEAFDLKPVGNRAFRKRV